jgi:hypothetical protein
MRALRRGTTAAALLGLVIGSAAPAALAAPPITLTVTNGGVRSVDGLYLSLYADRGWGPDLLNGVALAPGSAVTLQSVACDAAAIVVIAEDDAGCFLYRSVPCGADASWTITSTTTRDCGR